MDFDKSSTKRKAGKQLRVLKMPATGQIIESKIFL